MVVWREWLPYCDDCVGGTSVVYTHSLTVPGGNQEKTEEFLKVTAIRMKAPAASDFTLSFNLFKGADRASQLDLRAEARRLSRRAIS